MKHRANTPRLAILACLPATQAEIHTKTKVSQAAVSRWLTYLRDCGEAHISGWHRNPDYRAVVQAIYHPGPGADVVCNIRTMTQKERDRLSRKTRRANGDWENRKAAERARYWVNKPVRRDPLTAALFGRA